jgi:IS30 family transposase
VGCFSRRVGDRPRLVVNRTRILTLSQEGCTIREIAEEMGISPASVHRILKEHHRRPGDLVAV